MKNYALITGASSGIGREFAKQLSNQGYPLILIARRYYRLEEIKQACPTEVIIITADLTKESELDKIYYQIMNKKIDIFINNAGYGLAGAFLDTSLQKEVNMIHVNVKAMHILFKKIYQKMYQQGYGKILNVASSAGLLPAGPYMSTYYASKAYVTSLTQGVAYENENNDIYIGCLCPGPVDTEFNKVAEVTFSLKGINVKDCVSYALIQMEKKQTVIIPTKTMKLMILLNHIAPRKISIPIIAHQQKKKQGK